MLEITLRALILINGSLLFILISLFALLIMQKYSDIKVKERKEKLKNKLRQPLFQYVDEGIELKTRLFQREPFHYKVAEELLYDFRSITKGDESIKRIQLFAENYLADYYLEQLCDHRWSIRMNTLYAIENFGISSLEKHVCETFNRSTENSVERYQQLRVLAKLQSQFMLAHLTNEGCRYPLFVYKEVLRRMNRDCFDQMVSHYDEVCDVLKIAIISLFAEKRDTSYLPLVERELENGHLDVRMQALKVIRSFGYVTDVKLLIPFAKSSLWQERMMFCKIANVLKKERFKGLLDQLIEDDSWWVRNAAGEALASFPDGDFILAHIVETSKDGFARDMAQRWITGGENS